MSAARNRKRNVGNTEMQRLLEKLKKCESELKQIPTTTSSGPYNLYFEDGLREIDFILVFNRNSSPEAKAKVNQYIWNLEREGLEFEGCNSKAKPNILFIKVHGQTEMLIKRARLFDIEFSYENRNEVPSASKWNILTFMYTELTRPDPHSLTYQRAPESVSGNKTRGITSAERILLVHELLKHAKYGVKSHHFGVASLIKERSLVTAYPLHDGDYNWTHKGPLNDRQLLSAFWAKQHLFYKYQPLDLIQKYYGPEVGFYFAFYGYYNKMLVWASIMGLISTFYGLLTVNTDLNFVSQSICNAKADLCPYCYYPEICDVQGLKSYCHFSKISYILDNTGTFCYAIIMCFWATIFLELWKRKQKTLMYKWNLLSVEDDITLRNQFIINAKHWRKSRYEDIMVPYEKTSSKIMKSITSFMIIQLCVVIMISVIFGTILVRIFINYCLIKYKHISVKEKKVTVISNMTVNLVIVVFMITCEQLYQLLAKVLTDFENPRTQLEYDKHYIYKQYCLYFLNAYGHLYYTSFFKGIVFSYPGDAMQYQGIGIVNADLCGPLGCIVQIAMQLVTTITGKIAVKFLLGHLTLYLIRYYKRKMGKTTSAKLPIWERTLTDYKSNYYFLLKDYRELIMQYGYIVLFTAAFPLTPLMALLCNSIDLRIDAYKYTKFHRRPVPLRTCGIGAWNNVLNTVTYIGVVTNAFLIAFSTHFVPDMIKKLSKQYYNEDFLKYTVSSFAVKDYGSAFPDELRVKMNKTCMYIGKRYPPEHKLKYQKTAEHWYELSIRFMSVLILEVLVICFTGLLGFMISDVPRPIREFMVSRRKAEKDKKEEELNNAFRKSQVV